LRISGTKGEGTTKDLGYSFWRWWSTQNKANAGERMASKAKVCNSMSYHLMELE